MQSLVFGSIFLVPLFLNANQQEKTAAAVNEIGGFVVGRLCNTPQNDTVCCFERYSLEELRSTYPSVIPYNLMELDTSIPQDPWDYVRRGGPDYTSRPQSRWPCELPSRWTPDLAEPYVVDVWYKEIDDGSYIMDEMRVVSPRCASEDVTLECQFC